MKNKGFTLIELLIVIAIICILTVTIVGQYSKYKERIGKKQEIHRTAEPFPEGDKAGIEKEKKFIGDY